MNSLHAFFQLKEETIHVMVLMLTHGCTGHNE